MDKFKFRVVIKHYYLKKFTEVQIETELDEVHGNSGTFVKNCLFLEKNFKYF